MILCRDCIEKHLEEYGDGTSRFIRIVISIDGTMCDCECHNFTTEKEVEMI